MTGATDETSLCYTCHGESGIGATTNVMDGIKYNAGTAGADKVPGSANFQSVIAGVLRAGGFVKAAIGTGHMYQYYTSSSTQKWTELIPPLYASYSGDTHLWTKASSGTGIGTGVTGSGGYVLQTSTSAHSVTGTPATAWGSGSTSTSTGDSINLSCTSCHDPHGNGNYRILRPVPSGAQTGTNGVTITDSPGTKVYTTTNYWLVDDPNSPQITVNAGTSTYASSTFLANISAWCGTCHTRLLDSSSSWANALQDPNTTSVTIVAGSGTTNGTFATQGGVEFPSLLTIADYTPVMFTNIGTASGLSLQTMYYLQGCTQTTTATDCVVRTTNSGTGSTGAKAFTAAASGLSAVMGTFVSWAAGGSQEFNAQTWDGVQAKFVSTPPADGSQIVLYAVTAGTANTASLVNVNLGVYSGRFYKVIQGTGPAPTGNGITVGNFVLQGYDAHNGGSWSTITPGQAGSAMFVTSANVTADSTYTFRHTSDKGYVSSYNGGTNSPAYSGTGTRDAWANNPNCITCHVAHGSNASMAGDGNSTTSNNVPWPGGTGQALNGNTPATQDSFLLRVDNRGTCRSCHNY